MELTVIKQKRLGWRFNRVLTILKSTKQQFSVQNKVKPLQHYCKVNSDTIHEDPNVLFQRLIMLVDRADDMTNCFEYELTPEQTSLFKDGLMRKPNKAQLRRELVKDSEILSKSSEVTIYVLDGGALLHRVFWNVPATYSNIMEQYPISNNKSTKTKTKTKTNTSTYIMTICQ